MFRYITEQGVVLYLKASGFWFVLLLVAVGMGALRDVFLTPRFGTFRAHQVETLAGCLVFVGLIVLFVRWTRPTDAEAWTIGIGWTLATVAFEFGFFGLVARRPMAELFAAYDLTRGELWSLLLATVLLAPPIAARLAR